MNLDVCNTISLNNQCFELSSLSLWSSLFDSNQTGASVETFGVHVDGSK